MQFQRLKASIIASLAILALVGCGASPQLAKPATGSAYKSVRAVKTSSIPEANPDEQDISKNPFVIWIKQKYPQTAATIINQYLAADGNPNPDPAAEGQRVLLRRQALDTVTTELLKNVNMGLPQGLTAKISEPRHVRISGYQKQFGFKIDLQFEFVVTMDRAGMIWIRTPKDLVKASADSALVRLFGGNLNDKVYTELMKEIDKQGPPNQKKTPGLTYTRGGTFKVDPGFAFVNMPA